MSGTPREAVEEAQPRRVLRTHQWDESSRLDSSRAMACWWFGGRDRNRVPGGTAHKDRVRSCTRICIAHECELRTPGPRTRRLVRADGIGRNANRNLICLVLARRSSVYHLLLASSRASWQGGCRSDSGPMLRVFWHMSANELPGPEELGQRGHTRWVRRASARPDNPLGADSDPSQPGVSCRRRGPSGPPGRRQGDRHRCRRNSKARSRVRRAASGSAARRGTCCRCRR